MSAWDEMCYRTREVIARYMDNSNDNRTAGHGFQIGIEVEKMPSTSCNADSDEDAVRIDIHAMHEGINAQTKKQEGIQQKTAKARTCTLLSLTGGIHLQTRKRVGSGAARKPPWVLTKSYTVTNPFCHLHPLPSPSTPHTTVPILPPRPFSVTAALPRR